jgi:hypothetical protein
MSDPVHQIGTHLAQLTTGAQLAEQLGQEWSQSLTTHLIGELPARPQQRRVFWPEHRWATVAWWQCRTRKRPTQELDGVFPVVPGRGAELVQNPALLLAARPLIPHDHPSV